MKRLLRFLIVGFFLIGGASAHDLKSYTGGETPPLRLADLAGKPHDLKDLTGKVVMVQFWATYCAPCVKEMPSVMRLKAMLAGKPFAILAVNMGESEPEIRAFLKKIKVDLDILVDPDAVAIGAWKVFVAPSTFLLDGKGKIRYTLQGGAEWDTPDVAGLIQALIDETTG